MEIYTVSFFGHREIDNAVQVERNLEDRITELIRIKQYVEFLVGREGEFDILAASVVKRVKKRIDHGNCSLILILPYMKAEFRDNEKEFLEYYDEVEVCEQSAKADEVEVCEQSAKAHYKAAMQIRNRAMVDRSDLVICCIQRKSGGAYKTVQYAEDHGVETDYV